jgi:asparaginyl-tRNA synthetase
MTSEARPTLPESVRNALGRARADAPVTLAGWVRSARHSKNVSFIDLSDGSCLSGVQVVAEPALPGYAEHVARLRTGCAVEVEGRWVESAGREQTLEVRASAVRLVGDIDDDYPLQKKRHGFEFLRTIGHLRPRTNTIGAVWRIRSETSFAVHEFFQERGFYLLHTPIITLTDAEGAGELFRVTTLDPQRPPARPDGSVDWTQDFFAGEAHLTVSGQLEAEVGALALSRVYTFGPTFRAENSNTTRHLAEFWMIEPEVSFCTLDGLRALAEEFLKQVLRRVLERCAEDLALFDERIDRGILERHARLLETPFAHLSYGECVERLARAKVSFEHPVHWGMDLQTEHERHLCEVEVGGPLVVTDYPAKNKAFYMYRNDDGKTVRAMDVLVPGIGEIIGGSQREHRLDVLREQVAMHGLAESDYAWYFDLRRFGSVPHAGFGLGFERFIRFITGMDNIRDVIPFPRAPGTAGF